MCGIVAFVGSSIQNLSEHLVNRLIPLEYRGYDSAGVTILDERKRLVTVKTVGGLNKLKERLHHTNSSTLGFAHTRWATHGTPSERNALPIATADGKVAIIFNGIIENHLALRKILTETSTAFNTDNDAETLLLWILKHYRGDLLQAVFSALKTVDGRYGFCMIHSDHPDAMIAVRRGSPLIIGVGKLGHYIASDVIAIQNDVEHVHYMEDHSVAWIRKNAFHLWNIQGSALSTNLKNIPATDVSHLDARFETYTKQEIHAQPETIATASEIAIAGLKEFTKHAKEINRVLLIGCGSAHHANSVGASLIQKYARMPAVAIVASEFRGSYPILDQKTLVIVTSQSGETADTLSCLELAKELKCLTLALCNVGTSSMARQADLFMPIGCGREIGVASTKAYTGMLIHLAFLALRLGIAHGTVTQDVWREHCRMSTLLPEQIANILDRSREIEKMSRSLRERKNFLFVGKELDLATSLEAALKLRELSYRHAEGIGAGELKHGTLALLETQYPVIAIAPRSTDQSPKMINCIQEMKARGGQVWGIVSDGDVETANICHQSFAIPQTISSFVPILTVIPLQIFAYEFAKTLGRNIDRPRNLAKSVTVE